ncbi:BTB/POZ and MATH domain-containing protein 2-like [Aegilops tauschii subsp. strangulata]|uniref:BTB/POZ and MATH domain-containing protein 2-like n=1 Tax=Aegilops tauschii subsp. strangulata TaxID=200361 RepID=UPI00098A7F89|nr:BTB/POZ and MATH domain-containing protein 2-like [Aegilops tauschii subsp. strangulata]
MASNSTAAVSHGQCLTKSSSRCLTPSFTATHNFEVTSYPLLQGIGVEKLVSSTVFSVGGFNWTISFFPDGVRHGSFGNASAFLNCLSPEKDVRARFTLNLLDKSGTQVTKFEEMEYIFTPKCVYRGYAQFIGKSWLKSWSDSNGSFIIRCVLTVIGEPRSEVRRNHVLVPGRSLQDQLEDMRKKGEGADVTFSVCGQLFHAHRCLLAARSPVFKAELFGPMKEKATRSIKVEDIEPPIFEALLHFVYTDSLPDDEQSKDWNTAKLQHLLVAADRYGLDGLMVLCESKLCESIDVETVATTLVLAEQHHCKDLQEACVEFMAPQNVLQAVMATDGFKHLVASCPLLMKDILDRISRTD